MHVFQIIHDWDFNITLGLGFILGKCFVIMFQIYVDVKKFLGINY